MVGQIVVVIAAFSILVSAYPTAAQPAKTMYRIGFLTSGHVDAFKDRLAAFRQGLQSLGYFEGKNIQIEERYASGQRKRLPELAAELVRLNIDIFVAHGGNASLAGDRAAKAARKTIPVVFAQQADPVGSGLVETLARPGGNITGLSDYHSDLVSKRLELITEVLPSAKRIAVIWSPVVKSGRSQLKAVTTAARKLRLTILPVVVRNPDDYDPAFFQLQREHPDAINVLGYQKGGSFGKRSAEFALKNRMATIYVNLRHVRAGGLMSYGVNNLDLYRRAAAYVDKIFRGAKPAELPVEQPKRFYLTVNLKTAKALGITIPRSILLRADRVIE